MSGKAAAPAARVGLPELGCACATVRRASRLVTQMYGRHLRAFEMEAPQMSLLMAIDAAPGRSQRALAAMLGFEKATMSRNLRVLARRGWVRADGGRREAGLFLTEDGLAARKRAAEGWEGAQRELEAAMTAEEWGTMWKGLRVLTWAAQAGAAASADEGAVA